LKVIGKRKLKTRQREQGVALIVVMMVIVVLGALAGSFAYTMKVETTLARSANNESEMEWLGRSGVEMARYVLGQHMSIPNEGNYDALNQFWAGGPMATNDVLMNIDLNNIELGRGRFGIKIIDLERRMNINLADQVILQQALKVMGVDFSQTTSIVNSILDWRDTDDYTLTDGTESDYYQGLPKPYLAKNGPIDDLSELLLIRGVTPEMYWGAAATNFVTMPVDTGPLSRMRGKQPVMYPVGFADLFTTIGQRTLNINTASSYALQLIPGIDENIASSIITARAGPDGVEGNEDDTPIRTTADLNRIPGFALAAQSGVAQLFNVRSATFQVTVTADLGGRKAEWVGIVARSNPQNIRILSLARK
jgi:general secretion pathway protein K